MAENNPTQTQRGFLKVYENREQSQPGKIIPLTTNPKNIKKKGVSSYYTSPLYGRTEPYIQYICGEATEIDFQLKVWPFGLERVINGFSGVKPKNVLEYCEEILKLQDPIFLKKNSFSPKSPYVEFFFSKDFKYTGKIFNVKTHYKKFDKDLNVYYVILDISMMVYLEKLKITERLTEPKNVASISNDRRKELKLTK